jgi:hypothetical protein
MGHAYTVISFKYLADILALHGVKLLGGAVHHDAELTLYLAADHPEGQKAKFIPFGDLQKPVDKD